MRDAHDQHIAELIQRCREGDDRAFAQLVAHFGPAIYRFILRMVRKRQIAEDVYQETWMRVCDHLDRYDERGCFKSWLFQIANRLCLNQRRSLRSMFVPLAEIFERVNGRVPAVQMRSPERLPDVEVEQQEAMALVEKALDLMPVKQKQVFLLRLHAEMSFKEIAAILDRPLNTVLTQMRAALGHLHKKMSEQYDDL
jgi:RNA polymerase sigma-70 factor (ECF subfamily)